MINSRVPLNLIEIITIAVKHPYIRIVAICMIPPLANDVHIILLGVRKFFSDEQRRLSTSFVCVKGTCVLLLKNVGKMTTKAEHFSCNRQAQRLFNFTWTVL